MAVSRNWGPLLRKPRVPLKRLQVLVGLKGRFRVETTVDHGNPA